MTISEDADRLFPYFISHHLPVGASGLVVSGMLAAAMSSLDSGITSITAVVMTDFVSRFREQPLGQDTRTRLSRRIALAIGLVVISTSAFMQHVPGNFLETSQRTVGLFVTPLFSLFFFSLFVRNATQTGAILGSAVGLLTATLVAFWKSPTGSPMISFQYILPECLLMGVVSGWIVSRFRSKQ